METECIRIILDIGNRGGQSARTIVPDIKCIRFDERAFSLSAEMEGPVGIVIARWIPTCSSLCPPWLTPYSPTRASFLFALFSSVITYYSLSLTSYNTFRTFTFLNLRFFISFYTSTFSFLFFSTLFLFILFATYISFNFFRIASDTSSV